MALIPQYPSNARHEDDSVEADEHVEREAEHVGVDRRLLFQDRLAFVLAVGALDALGDAHLKVLNLALLHLQGVDDERGLAHHDHQVALGHARLRVNLMSHGFRLGEHDLLLDSAADLVLNELFDCSDSIHDFSCDLLLFLVVSLSLVNRIVILAVGLNNLAIDGLVLRSACHVCTDVFPLAVKLLQIVKL